MIYTEKYKSALCVLLSDFNMVMIFGGKWEVGSVRMLRDDLDV